MARVQANGLGIEVRDVGAAAGPAILLIRGLGTQLVQWPDEFVATLTEAGFRAVLFDNRDVGLSEKLDAAGSPDLARLYAAALEGRALGAPYDLFDMARDAVGVLDALGIERAHVVGTSMGGMIAQILAARHEERVASLVSMMSSSGAPGLPTAQPAAARALLAAPANPGDRDSLVVHFMEVRRAIGSPRFRVDDAALRSQVEAALDRCYHPPGVARQAAAIAASGSRAELLGEIAVPTLVIHGDADPLVPIEAGRDSARRIPGARLEVIEGMGHDLVPALARRIASLVADHAGKAEARRGPASRSERPGA